MDEPLSERLTADEAEAYVLGVVIFGHVSVIDLLQELDKTHFFRETHRQVFQAIADLGDSVSPEAIIERLQAMGSSLKRSFVLGLGSVHGYRSFEAMAATVRTRCVLRGLADTAQHCLSDLKTADLDEALELADRVERRLSEATLPLRRDVGEYRGRKTLRMLGDAVQAKSAGGGGERVSVRTWDEIDRFVQFDVGSPNAVGAVTAGGKSAFAGSLADHWAERGDSSVYFTHEDTAEKLYYRLLAQHSGIPSQRIVDCVEHGERSREATEIRGCVADWVSFLNQREGQIIFDDSPYMTVDAIRHRIRDYRRDGVTRFFIDYLQEIEPPRHTRGRGRNDEIAAIAKGLRNTFKEQNVCGVVLSQLNREAQGREEPELRDFLYSSAIEQTCRTAIILRRPAISPKATVDFWHRLEVWIIKATHGKTGLVQFIYEPERTLARPMTREERDVWGRCGNGDKVFYRELRGSPHPHRQEGWMWPQMRQLAL